MSLSTYLKLVPGRVALGKKFLKKRYPGFKPNTDNLDINSPCNCILGQAGDAQGRAADYYKEREFIGASMSDAVDMGMHPDPALYGCYDQSFTPARSESDMYVAALKDEWRRQLSD